MENNETKNTCPIRPTPFDNLWGENKMKEGDEVGFYVYVEDEKDPEKTKKVMWYGKIILSSPGGIYKIEYTNEKTSEKQEAVLLENQLYEKERIA